MIESSFSFRKVREQDTLRYNQDYPYTERRRSKLSKSMPMSSRSQSPWPAFDRSAPDCENPTYFEMEKMRLEGDIKRLVDEVQPLRDRCHELIGSPTPGRRRKLYRRQSVREIDVYERPPVVGVTASELMELQREYKATKEECQKWKDELRSFRLERLRDDILVDIDEVQRSLRKYETGQAEEEEYRKEIAKYRVSSMYDRVQEQKEYIESMREIIRGEVDKYRQLKKKYVKLKHREYQRLSSEEIESLPEIIELNHRLARALDDLKTAKERYVNIRDTQIHEVETMYDMKVFRESTVPVSTAPVHVEATLAEDEDGLEALPPQTRIFKLTSLRTPVDESRSKTAPHRVFHSAKKRREESPRRTK